MSRIREARLAIASLLEITRRKDCCFQTCLRKILGIKGNQKIRIAGFGAEAKRVILGIGRNLNRGMHLHLFGPFADQVDDSPDEIRTNVEALKNFLVFFQNVFCYEPYEIVLLGPPVEYVGAWISAGNERLSEGRYASHKHARVNNGPWLAFSIFLRQR